MRRPIFGNGIPRNVLTADGNVAVLDTEDLDENDVYALTLFMWPYDDGAGPFVLPAFTIDVSTEGGAPVALASYSAGYLATVFASLNGPPPIEPIKVLDKYMVRGQQKVTVRNDAVGNAVCFVWGYFEAVGEQDVGVPFRGLQPGALVKPYPFSPVEITLLIVPAAPPQSQIKTLHTLDPNYIDLVTVDVAFVGASDVAGEYAAGIIVPNTLIPLPSISIFGTTGLIRNRIFDGIPMRANGPAPAQSQLSLAVVTGVGGGGLARAYGSFMRF